jgi:uncharacterized protein (TIGR02996 family)
MVLQDETFIQAILENPQEEANWLVYADWLEERGDPRAALYRQRCLTNSLGMEFVLVPRGSFWLFQGGRHARMEMAHEFYLGVHPVTQQQWQDIMGSNPSGFSRTGQGRERVEKVADADLEQFPVEMVSWEDAQEFIREVQERDRSPGGWLYRSPTEEEWEYACRGAARSPEDCSFHFYLDRPANDLSSDQANFDGNRPAGSAAKGPYLERTTKVCSYQPNRLGLYDLHGNVWEWTDSVEDTGRVCRGGSWLLPGFYCRVVSRFLSAPSRRCDSLGFRLALTPSGAKGE